ncbi:hypothetical protein QRB38_12750 [Mycobacterium avium subsp. hominissuis]|uniref:hypothetical protein n=1 Tax=Mycobacterium avium TaxID=1764 RepID=UPI00266630E0|nr:hypothetical protein [Mycobacterium avium]MDO2394678.1 hypothetical protein [Mycobacterium avium subsp. hominissuis]
MVLCAAVIAGCVAVVLEFRAAERRRGLPVTSTCEAFDFAHSILAARTCDVPRLVGVPRSVDHDTLWRAVAQRPLTALVYAASQQPRPLAWLEHTVRQLVGDDQDGGWRAAVEAVAAVDSELCAFVKSASTMERRQRGSVAIVMGDAVAEYAAGRR